MVTNKISNSVTMVITAFFLIIIGKERASVAVLSGDKFEAKKTHKTCT